MKGLMGGGRLWGGETLKLYVSAWRKPLFIQASSIRPKGGDSQSEQGKNWKGVLRETFSTRLRCSSKKRLLLGWDRRVLRGEGARGKPCMPGGCVVFKKAPPLPMVEPAFYTAEMSLNENQ